MRSRQGNIARVWPSYVKTRPKSKKKKQFLKEWVLPGYDFNDEIGEKRFGLGVDSVTKEKYGILTIIMNVRI